MFAGRHTEDEVQLLERALHCLWDQEEDENKGQNVKACVETECSRWRECLQQRGKCKDEDGANGVIYAYGEGGANLTVRERERLAKVDGGKRSHSWSC